MDKFQNAWFLLEKLMSSTLDSIYFKDRQSRFKMVNQACAAKHGWTSPEEAIGKTDCDSFTAEHARQALADEQRIIESGQPLIGKEEKETWPDGRVTWCSTSKMPLIDENGYIFGIIGITRDITTSKEAELRANHYSEQVRLIKEEIENDVRMAAELQKAFFPQSYPSFPKNASNNTNCVEFSHYNQASGIISGDICTIRYLSPTTVGIFICDVMGHGVRAALGTALICALVEELSSVDRDPGHFLAHLNHLLLPKLHDEGMLMFATACYAVFDVSNGLLRVANAGHPIPLHFRQKGNIVEWLIDNPDLRGCALAITEDAEYQTVEKRMEAGDSVVMYTDGLFEAEREDGEEFGEERLISAAKRHGKLKLPKLFSELINEALVFANQTAPSDDICMIGFRFKHPMD